jgi:hypothetical protein
LFADEGERRDRCVLAANHGLQECDRGIAVVNFPEQIGKEYKESDQRTEPDFDARELLAGGSKE